MPQNKPEAAESTETSQDISKYAPKYIPIESIIEYYRKGLSKTDIAKVLGCHHSNISNRLKPYLDEIETLDVYKAHRADVIALKGKEILKNITPDKIEKASAYQLTGMYSILYDKERLERGESTANIANIHGDIAAIKAQERSDQHTKTIQDE